MNCLISAYLGRKLETKETLIALTDKTNEYATMGLDKGKDEMINALKKIDTSISTKNIKAFKA